MKTPAFISISCLMILLSACQSFDLSRQIEKGKTQYKNDSIETAIQTFSVGLEYSDTCKECLLWRANSYKQINDLDKALADLNKLIILDSSIPSAFANIASIYYLKSDYKNALNNYERALLLKPDFKLLYNPISHMLFIDGQKDESCRYYIMALEIGDTAFDQEIVEYCETGFNGKLKAP